MDTLLYLRNIYIKTLKNLLRESKIFFFSYHNQKRLSRLLTITPCRAWEHSALSSGPQDGDRILLLTSIFLSLCGCVLQGSSLCLLTASPLLLHSHFWVVIWSGLRQLIFTTLVFLLRCLYDFLPWMKLIINNNVYFI